MISGGKISLSLPVGRLSECESGGKKNRFPNDRAELVPQRDQIGWNRGDLSPQINAAGTGEKAFPDDGRAQKSGKALENTVWSICRL